MHVVRPTRAFARILLGLALSAIALPTGAAPEAAPAAEVSALRFEGVSSVDESELRGAVLTTARSRWPWDEPPPPFDEDVLREDLERVTETYQRHGYYGARAQYELSWSADREEVEVEIQVEEGQPVLLESLSLDASEAAAVELGDESSWRDALELQPGEPFAVPAYSDAKKSILARVKEQGFLGARLEGGAEVDPIAHTAFVAWKLRPGPRVRVAGVRTLGLESVAPSLVQRHVRLATGDVVTPSALRTTQRAVYETGLFRTVSIQTVEPTASASMQAQPAEEHRIVEIRVEERPPRSLRTSLGYGTEDGVRARVGWEHRNWLGGARRLDFEARYSSLVYGVSAGFTQPDFPDLASEGFVRGKALREEEPAYDADRILIGPGIERRFGEHLVGRIGVGVEWTQLLDSATDPRARLDFREGTTRLGLLGLGLDWADLDDALNPTRGVRFDTTLRTASRWLGSQVGFVQATAKARAYVPVGPTVLALKLGIGSIEPIDGDADRDIPIFERFFTGGSTTVRGFDYHEVGPKDADGDPLGGLSLLEASAELRFPLWRALGGVVFVDAGGLGPRPFDLFGDISVSAGAGLRYETPVGPLRLDVGRAVHDRSGADEFRIHFSIGQAF